MAMTDFAVFNTSFMHIGNVKAHDSHSAISRAKRQYPYCVAPMVQLLSEYKAIGHYRPIE